MSISPIALTTFLSGSRVFSRRREVAYNSLIIESHLQRFHWLASQEGMNNDLKYFHSWNTSINGSPINIVVLTDMEVTNQEYLFKRHLNFVTVVA